MEPATVGAPVSPAPAATPPAPAFEIGLVMAGAISAGAYTAGVVSFLFEALTEWNETPWATLKSGETGLPWPVRLKTMAGASAGGMCAALTLLSALKGNNGDFRKAWVEDIDIKPLLESNDLAQFRHLLHLPSVLNCQVLDDIAKEVVKLPEQRRWPSWLGANERFDFFLTLTNLNGLTYAVEQNGATAQRFTDHADRVHFQLRPHSLSQTAPTPELCELPFDDPADPGWTMLREAALATGAFPIALASRSLRFENAYFDLRTWYDGNQRTANIKRAVAPDLKPGETAAYRFVDGGVTDNKPFELARRALLNRGAGEQVLPCRDDQATRAVLMIDPFPSEEKDGAYEEIEARLGPLTARLYQALRNQSRFKTEELLNALDLSISSRFAIAPNRRDAQDEPVTPALASSTLGAFGGFLHHGFREHDYALGRRNCQYFLQRWFVLSEENPLFDQWDAAQRAAYYVRESAAEAGSSGGDGLRRNERGECLLPILPLRQGGRLQQEDQKPSWRAARLPPEREQQIGEWLYRRLDGLAGLLKNDLPSGSFQTWALRRVFDWKRKSLVTKGRERAMELVRHQLNTAGLR